MTSALTSICSYSYGTVLEQRPLRNQRRSSSKRCHETALIDWAAEQKNSSRSGSACGAAVNPVPYGTGERRGLLSEKTQASKQASKQECRSMALLLAS